MMAEALLLFACLNNTGCAETAAQYRVYNPAPFMTAEKYTEDLGRQFMASYWGPVLAYGLGREGTVKLHRNVGLTISQKQQRLLYSYEF